MLNSTRRFVHLIAIATLVASCGGGSSGPTGPSGPPVVNLVNGATLPSGTVGTTVVIQGSNFGASQAVATGHVVFSTTAGGRDTATISTAGDWTNNLIVTAVPTGVPQGTDTLFVKTAGGASTPVIFTVLKAVTFNPSTISWTSTTALPLGLSGHAVAAATLAGASPTSVVYVVGGATTTNAPRDSVLYATVSNTGTVGAWTKTTVLPANVAFAAALVATPNNSPVAANSYLYVIGGDSSASGKPVASVYVGTLSGTGAVTGWTATTSLPAPVHSLGATILNGNIYIAGGSGIGNAPVPTVYRAAIQSDGTLGAWQALSSLPFARSYFGFGVNGTTLYAFGGDSGVVTPNDSSVKGSAVNDVVYAQIDVHTGNLTAAGWTANANKLKKVVTKHTAVVAAGNVLITAGLYTGATTGATEETYAALNADGSTGAFNGATGSNTISSAGGGNIFNHGATGYLDGAGAFHILVVGGDDVNTPTAGKHTGVFYH